MHLHLHQHLHLLNRAHRHDRVLKLNTHFLFLSLFKHGFARWFFLWVRGEEEWRKRGKFVHVEEKEGGMREQEEKLKKG